MILGYYSPKSHKKIVDSYLRELEVFSSRLRMAYDVEYQMTMVFGFGSVPLQWFERVSFFDT